MNPNFTFELPEGDNREIKIWYLEKTGNNYHFCVSIEDKNMSDYSNTHWMKDLPDTPKTISQTTHDRIKSRKTDNSPPNPFAEMQTYEPATTTVDESFLFDCKELLETGLEFTQAALAEHDASLGRTTFKNKSWAETMEESIDRMRSCIQMVDGFLAKF